MSEKCDYVCQISGCNQRFGNMDCLLRHVAKAHGEHGKNSIVVKDEDSTSERLKGIEKENMELKNIICEFVRVKMEDNYFMSVGGWTKAIDIFAKNKGKGKNNP